MHLVFDLDGTLFETGPGLLRAVSNLCRTLGVPQCPEKIVQAQIGRTTGDFLSALFPGIAISAEQIKAFRADQVSAIRKYGRLYPEVRPLLEILVQQGHSLSICSNGSLSYIEEVLQATNSRQYFKHIFSARQSGKSAVLSAIQKTSRDTVYIGDTCSDYQAALDAHTPFVFASYGYGDRNIQNGPAFVIDSPGQLPEWTALFSIFFEIEKHLLYPGNIIGINGVDTSGKTEFTARLSLFLTQRNIGNQIIHIDDFHNPSALRRQGANEVDAYYENAFDYQRLIGKILDPWKKEKQLDAELACFNLETDDYDRMRTFHFAREDVILLEGTLLFRPPLLPYINKKIFLDIGFDEVLRRARIRDVPKYGPEFLQKYKDKYIPIQKRYLCKYQPKEAADLVIDNTDYRHPKILKEIE